MKPQQSTQPLLLQPLPATPQPKLLMPPHQEPELGLHSRPSNFKSQQQLSTSLRPQQSKQLATKKRQHQRNRQQPSSTANIVNHNNYWLESVIMFYWLYFLTTILQTIVYLLLTDPYVIFGFTIVMVNIIFYVKHQPKM
jgi:hypothetical protein